MDVEEVRALVARSLTPGDSEATVVGFFQEYGLAFDFDAHQGRYQSHWPTEQQSGDVKSGIAIWIYVHKDGSFQKAVVEEVFTSY